MKKSAYEKVLKRYTEAQEALDKAVAAGAQSASISSGGGSKSYTRYSIPDLKHYVAELRRKLWSIKTGKSSRMPKTIGVRFDG